MVRMWHARLALMWLIIAASVVDLPEPVGPVTSTSPRRRSARLRIDGGQPSSSSVRILRGDGAEDRGEARRLVEVVGAKARLVAVRVGEVEIERLR